MKALLIFTLLVLQGLSAQSLPIAGGAAGTSFWIDPKEQMVGVFMINILPHTNLTFGGRFKQLAYQALE